MSDFENFILDNIEPIIEWVQKSSVISFFILCDKNFFYDISEGRKVLYESIDESSLLEFSTNDYFSYKIVDKHTIYTNNDYVIIKPDNLITACAFLLMGEFESEEVLGASDDVDQLKIISPKFLNPSGSDELFQKLEQKRAKNDWVLAFHAIHSDLNLCLVSSRKENCLSSYILKNANIVKGPISPDGIVNIEYMDK